MTKFRSGDWVRLRERPGCGRVCGHRDRSALVRWIGSRKAEPHGTRRLRKCSPPRALVLEGSLDGELESTRSEESVLRTWLGANEVPLAYKNVHALEDIAVISRAVGHNKPAFVHISCHGDHDVKRPFLLFAPNSNKRSRIYLDDDRTISVFREAFAGLPILFSACLLGKYKDPMVAFRKNASVPVVGAFSREVFDSEAMLFELLLYQGVFTNGWNFRTAATKACQSLLHLGLKGGRGNGQSLIRLF